MCRGSVGSINRSFLPTKKPDFYCMYQGTLCIQSGGGLCSTVDTLITHTPLGDAWGYGLLRCMVFASRCLALRGESMWCRKEKGGSESSAWLRSSFKSVGLAEGRITKQQEKMSCLMIECTGRVANV